MTRLFTLTLLACLPLVAADQVVLTNGDIISGTIIKKDGDKLTIKSEFMGEVSMPWTSVKSVKSDSEVFVQLPSGEIVKGKLATSGDQLQVAAGPEVKSAPLAQVTAVRDAGQQHNYERMQNPGLLDLWAGNFDMGWAATRGNSRSGTFTTAFRADRITRMDKVSVFFNSIYASARINNVSSTTASAIRGGWQYDRNLTPRFFVSAINNYDHDRFQNLDLRFVFGLGAGYRAIKKENLALDLDAGANYAREKYIDGLQRNFAEINYGDSLLWKVSKYTSFTQAFHMFNNMNDTGSYRINMDVSAVTAMRRWLSFQVTASDRFLNRPLQGRQRNDLVISTGLRFTFAK